MKRSGLRGLRLALAILLTGLPLHSALANEDTHHQTHSGAHRHHLSVLTGSTRFLMSEGSDEDAFTVGIDYEYRINQRYGAGFVAEYAVDPLDATSLLGALDVHLVQGLVLQLGLGVEFVEGTSNELARMGFLYEFEFDAFTLSPQLHYDATSEEDSIVFGLAVGVNF
ncbi:MAG: hypothetical protein AB8B93_10855 [Pseudomonadales bacterium]